MASILVNMKAAARRRIASGARAALARVEPSRTVMVSEYPVRPNARWGWGKPAHPELSALFARSDDAYRTAIAGIAGMMDSLQAVPRFAEPPQPCWDNAWWGGIDAAYHMHALVTRRPATYLEVGAGRSTMLARHAIDAHELPTKLISIDPSPRAEIDALCDEVLRSPFEDVADLVADRLVPGDVVLIDGSHMTMMGGDTVVALLEFMPRLPPGVLVAVDDVFLPYDYHPTWAGRWYGEQYVLAAYLLGGGGGYEVTFPSLYVSQHPGLAEDLAPLWPVIGTAYGEMGSALWLERPVP